MAKNVVEKEYIEIDPWRLVQALWHRAWIIVLTVIVFGASLFSYAYFLVEPEYTASAMIYVNNSAISIGGAQLSVSGDQLKAAQSLVDTYVVILNSRTVLDKVRKDTGLTDKYTCDQLRNMISSKSVNDTEVFEINVVSTDPKEAEKIANAICVVLPQVIEEKINGTAPKIIDSAVVPERKSAPNVTQHTMIGMVIGFVVSCVAIIVMELFDQFIRSEEYLLQTFSDIPVLAVIPDLEGGTSKERYYYNYSSKGE